MRFFLAVILTALFAFIAGRLLPWYSIALAAFLVALLLPQSPGRSFLAGFLGIFLLWSILATWIDSANQHVLSKKIAEVLPLGGNYVLLIVLSAALGALVGGFAALSGASLRSK